MAGNIVGFARVAVNAYLLGTHSRADALAVAVGPVDALNGLLINSMVFAFVPMLTQRKGAERTALFLKLSRFFSTCFSVLVALVVLLAPWLIHLLAPGLDPRFESTAVTNLRIISLSSLAAGLVAVRSALLYTERRFAPTAFYQACLNLFTVAGALCLWDVLGVYGFAIGYTVGAWVQYGIVWWCARSSLEKGPLPACPVPWREILARPLGILAFTSGLAGNMIFTRAWATQAGPGMAAAFDYCWRGVSVPLAFLVSPISNSLLPEIARLRSQGRLRDAFRLIDRTVALAALAAVAGCGFAIALREPAIRILFQRGSFTAESTTLVTAVFLGLAPSMIGWSLMELISRSLFSMDRPQLPVITAAIPAAVNVAVTLALGVRAPQFVGLGASLGLMTGFAVLFGLARGRRKAWA
ncbi:MAG: oligosaccharide flippase family protein [Acidobacteria bacterium]|nr:oligosaccharide flippase family protein [Acidobacteriota bacterium]